MIIHNFICFVNESYILSKGSIEILIEILIIVFFMKTVLKIFLNFDFMTLLFIPSGSQNLEI